MIEQFTPKRKEYAEYHDEVPLPTLRDIPVTPTGIPQPLTAVFEYLMASQGSNFTEFGSDPLVKDVVLETTGYGESVYIACRISHDDNAIDGVAANADSLAVRFFTNMSGREEIIEVLLMSEDRESVAALTPRLEAVKEFSQNRFGLSVYSASLTTERAEKKWEELEAAGIARKITMVSGQSRYLLL